MNYKATTPQEYIQQIPDERKAAFQQLYKTIDEHLPSGFSACINYSMPSWVVPKSSYPDGYHCNPELPLPFISIASQKNYIAVYHSGIYADESLMAWFKKEYPKHVKTKLDMGKSCVRFKKIDQLPFELIAELCTKMTAKQWISLYEKNIKRK